MPETLPSNRFVSLPGLLVGGVLPLCWDAVGVFYSPNQFSKELNIILNSISNRHIDAYLANTLLPDQRRPESFDNRGLTPH